MKMITEAEYQELLDRSRRSSAEDRPSSCQADGIPKQTKEPIRNIRFPRKGVTISHAEFEELYRRAAYSHEALSRQDDGGALAKKRLERYNTTTNDTTEKENET